MIRILQGDALTTLRTLPAESVHCVVTSPPYWGLRDYGTGRWEGGDTDCEHRSPTMREGRNEDRQKLAGSAATNSYQNILAHNAHCGKCGAVKVDEQIGLEPNLGEHIAALVDVFREVRRVLRKDGTCWVNYGDAYASAPNGRSAADTKAVGNDDRTFRDKPISTVQGLLKPKDRMLLPARVAIALQEDGWWVRDEIVWHKPNPMPSSVKDRTTPAHEMIYMLTRSERYAYDAKAIREPSITGDARRPYGSEGAWQMDGREKSKRGGGKPRKVKVPGGWDKGEGAHGTVHRDGRTEAAYVAMEVSPWRQKRSVWTVPPKGFKEAHFATFPPALIEPCILAGCPPGGVVLDPFFGAGTTGLVCQQLGRDCIGIELNPEYVKLAERRLGLSVMSEIEELLT